MAPKILIAEPLRFSARAEEVLRGAGDVDLRACDRDALAQAFIDYDVILVRLAHRIDGAVIGRAPRCRILAVPATGLDHVDLDACAKHGIRVVSLKGETDFLRNVRATAELTIGLALALMRHIPAAAASVLDGEWDRDRFEGRELAGKTAGIVGAGRLGSIVGELLLAFGCRVIGFDRSPGFPSRLERVDTLDDLLARSDLVSLHVSLNASSRNLIGAKELGRMKPSAVLINTSRGGVVDEGALLEALERGTIAGAAIDVLASEPGVSGDDPLIVYARTHDNLLIVPHIGGKTSESIEKTEVFIAERIVEALRS